MFSLLFGLINTAFAIPTSTKVCPIIGPSFPKPTDIGSSSVFQNAIAKLDHAVDTALKTGHTDYGNADFNGTTWSLSFFETHGSGLLYQRHHTDKSVANSAVGVKEVDADTLYRLGSISKVLTTYILLIEDGDRRWNDPITDYISELVDAPLHSPNGLLPRWTEMTIADLAAHLAGIEADYGLNDEEFYESLVPALPQLSKSQIPVCGHENAKLTKWFNCTTEQGLTGLKEQPAIFAVAATPAYSNSGFDLVGLATEKITGKPLSTSFTQVFTDPLGLTRTFFNVPSNSSLGAISVNEDDCGWNEYLGFENPAGGYFSSTNDLAAIGKAIMNSTLLPLPLTRRWLKPRTFTASPFFFVGAPWEIYRWQTPGRLYDIYSKDGGVGTYSAHIALVPDLDFGFTILATGTEASVPSSTKLKIRNVMASIVLPAVENVAREQARQNFAGRYASSAINSSIVIATDEQPGLRVTKWISNGTDFLSTLGGTANGHYVDVRLWPNELYGPGKVGFSATWQTMPHPSGEGYPMPEACQQWGDISFFSYGNVNLGAFVFDVDASTGMASRAELKAFRISLEKQ